MLRTLGRLLVGVGVDVGGGVGIGVGDCGPKALEVQPSRKRSRLNDR